MKNYFLRVAFLTLFAAFFASCEGEKKEPQNAQNEPQSVGQISIKSGENPTQQDFWVSYDIYGNRLINFSPNNEQNATTKALGAVALARTPLQSINKALLRGQLSKNFIKKCSSCHDDYANGIIGPSLLDKTSDEIYAMISAYKDKSKKNVLMSELVHKMSDAEIQGFAREISEFNAQFRGAK